MRGGLRGLIGRIGSARLAVIAAAGIVTGCSGGIPQPSLVVGGLSSGQASAQAGSGLATADRMEGNPFSDGSASVIAGREVIAKPTIEQVMQPASTLPEMSLGRADAPVTLIKYASMTCPYCRQFQLEAFPELKRQYIDTGKMRFILREFPIGFQSGLATIATRCVSQDRYFQAYDRLMRQQGAWVSQDVRSEPIVKVLRDLGLTTEKLEVCRQDKALVSALDAVKQRGRLLGIVGTPNFFINGKLVKSTLTLGDVKAIVDPLLAAPKPVAQRS